MEEQEGRGEEKGQCSDSVQEEEREGWDNCCKEMVFLAYAACPFYICTRSLAS